MKIKDTQDKEMKFFWGGGTFLKENVRPHDVRLTES